MHLKFWTLLLAGALVVFAGIMVFSFDPNKHQDTATQPQSEGEGGVMAVPRAERRSDEPPAPPGPPKSTAGLDIDRPELDLRDRPAPLLVVDSFAPAEQSVLSTWSQLNVNGGHFDVLTIPAPASPGEGLSSDTLVAAQGWAGDGVLGWRMSDVLIAMCGRVVARARVSAERPDVAEAVHPNLLPSGWVAQIRAGDMPTCDDDRMTAWGVVPGEPARLAPLIGSHSFAVKLSGDGDRQRVSAQSNPDPAAFPLPPLQSIEVLASRANMRRCGSTACAVVAQVDRGVSRGRLLDRQETWSLIAFEDRVGWLFNRLYRVVE